MRCKYLLFIGLILSTVSVQAQAACLSSETTAALALKPLSSHYVQKVIERAEAGFNFTSAGTSPLDDPGTKLLWSFYAKGVVQDTINVGIDNVFQSYRLDEVTACKHVDLLVLEAHLEKARCELLAAYEQEEGDKMANLKNVLIFLKDKYQIVASYGTNPFYKDMSWGKLEWFDEVAAGDSVICRMPNSLDLPTTYCKNCCTPVTREECANLGGFAYRADFGLQTCLAEGGTMPRGQTVPLDGFMCPFTSDYLPATSEGYGCDASILVDYNGIDPIRDEYNGLEALVTKRNEFLKLASPIKDQRAQLDAFLGREPLDVSRFGTGTGAIHKTIVGCLQPFDQTTADATSSGTFTSNPLFYSGATFTEVRGPFWFSKNEPKLARLFLETMVSREQYRELPDVLKKADEFTDKNGIITFTQHIMGFFTESLKMFFRPERQQFQVQQAQQKAAAFSYVYDANAQLKDVFTSMRSNMRDITQGVTQKDAGMRKFAINFAWYLRRSCIERPCTSSLENVLKILFADECFPYANGTYKSGDSYEACKNAL